MRLEAIAGFSITRLAAIATMAVARAAETARRAATSRARPSPPGSSNLESGRALARAMSHRRYCHDLVRDRQGDPEASASTRCALDTGLWRMPLDGAVHHHEQFAHSRHGRRRVVDRAQPDRQIFPRSWTEARIGLEQILQIQRDRRDGVVMSCAIHTDMLFGCRRCWTIIQCVGPLYAWGRSIR